MEFWRTVFGLLRKKLIGPPLVLISILLGTGTYYVVPVTWVADVSVVLAAPVNGGMLSRDPAKPLGLTNPFLSFNDALKTGASIIILSMNTQDVWTELGAPKDGPTKITIDDGRSNPHVLDISGPYIYIQVASDSAAQAKTVLENGRRRIGDVLFEWQKALGAPPSTFIISTDIVPPAVPVADYSLKWQAAIGAALLGVVVYLGIAYGLLRRRSSTSPPKPVNVVGAVPEPLRRRWSVPQPVNPTDAVPEPLHRHSLEPQPVGAVPEPVPPAEGEDPHGEMLDFDTGSKTEEFRIYRDDLSSVVTIPWKPSSDDGEK